MHRYVHTSKHGMNTTTTLASVMACKALGIGIRLTLNGHSQLGVSAYVCMYVCMYSFLGLVRVCKYV